MLTAVCLTLLKNAVCSELNRLRYSSSTIHRVSSGMDLQKVKIGGSSKKAIQQLRAAGYTISSLRFAGYTAAELKEAGYNASLLRAAEYSLMELKAAGYPITALKAAGYTVAEIKNA